MKLPIEFSRLRDLSLLQQHRSLVLVALLAVLWITYVVLAPDDESVYLTAAVERGDIVSIVTATGTVTPVGLVEVGSQLSGQIAELLADFNDHVTKGQPLARLDAQGFEATVKEGEAGLEIAEANMRMQEAALDKAEYDLAVARASRIVSTAETDSMRAQREEAAGELARLQSLVERAAISGSEVDRAEARARTAAALLRAAETQELVGDATTQGAEAAVNMALARLNNSIAEVKRMSAVLERVKVDLERATIRSPIDGVVIGRNVDSGQTVAASLAAPTLFTLANDLRQMEVHAQVDQADIGQIGLNQTAVFAVDAYSDRVFSGIVTQIRTAPQIIQNVVTYTVIVSADNSEMLLLPGMTAILRITVAEISDVLKIPNAALRFRPADDIAAPAEASAMNGKLGMPDKGTSALIWVLDDRGISPRVVGYETGNANVAAVVSGELVVGALVVVGATTPTDSSFGLRLGS